MVHDELHYLSLSASDDGLAELEGRQRQVFVPHSEIRGLELVYGVVAERPILGAAFGLVCSLPVFWLILRSYKLIIQGGSFFFAEAIAGATGGVVGGLLLRASFQRRLQLVVVGPRGRRKLIIHGQVDRDSLDAFLTTIESRWGYKIYRSVTDSCFAKLGIPQRARSISHP